MKKLLSWILLAALALSGAALAEEYKLADANATHFQALLYALMNAYETPSEGDSEAIDSALDAIAARSVADGEVARAIADHWRAVYLDPDYPMYLYRGDGQATALLEAGFHDSAAHAFVVLGYELKNGEMTDELIGRCDAAAAAAKAFPSAILVCSGGATGDNNPQRHTEAGMMRDYLVNACGIDPGRVYTDERAMTTLENAVNTLAILRERNIETFTLVTSSYHQRWGQVLYNAMAALYRQEYGYHARLAGNFSFDIEPSDERFRQDDRIALRQLSAMLGLPMEK